MLIQILLVVFLTRAALGAEELAMVSCQDSHGLAAQSGALL